MASILVAIMSELVEAGARASWRLASMAAAEAERVGAIVVGFAAIDGGAKSRLAWGGTSIGREATFDVMHF